MTVIKEIIKPTYKLFKDDAIFRLNKLSEQGIKYHLVGFSPPFDSLFSYSDSKQDMGNSKSKELFYLHTRFFIAQLEKVVHDGRLVFVHIKNGSKTITSHGEQGLQDLCGAYRALMEERDFIWWDEITINKSAEKAVSRKPIPVMMHGTAIKDTLKTRHSIPDKILIFKKRGENKIPVPLKENVDFAGWCAFEDGVWMDIKETDVFRLDGKQAFRLAKDKKDERHLTPTQTEVYRRMMLMYMNYGESFLDPFVGSGTAFHIGLPMDIKVTGIELKDSYFDLSELVARKTAEQIDFLSRSPELF